MMKWCVRWAFKQTLEHKKEAFPGIFCLVEWDCESESVIKSYLDTTSLPALRDLNQFNLFRVEWTLHNPCCIWNSKFTKRMNNKRWIFRCWRCVQLWIWISWIHLLAILLAICFQMEFAWKCLGAIENFLCFMKDSLRFLKNSNLSQGCFGNFRISCRE
jgi:hypothetical protein